MEALELDTGSPTVHWEYTKSCIYFVYSKRVTPKIKHIDITVCFLQEQFESQRGLVVRA